MHFISYKIKFIQFWFFFKERKFTARWIIKEPRINKRK